MIQIKGRRDYVVALESVAMTDIVMNLFIFFFISFSLLFTFNPTVLSKLDINLPKAQSAVKLENTERVIISVSKDGNYFIDGERVRQYNLKYALKAKVKQGQRSGVLLEVDGLAKFDVVASALDVINDLKIRKVSIATIKKNK